jgi:hypothetical protein
MAKHPHANTVHERPPPNPFDDVGFTDTLDLRPTLDHTLSFSPSVCLPPYPALPSLDVAPWLASPRGGEATDEDFVAVLEDAEATTSVANFVNSSCTIEGGVHHSLSRGACERVVRMAWGDVPWPWSQGYTTVYDTGVDESVFLIEEDVLTSLEDDDDPSLASALSGPEREE